MDENQNTKVLKSELRAQVLARRDALRAQDVVSHSTGVGERFLRSVPYQDHSVFSGYWPIGNEVDVRPLMDRLIAIGQRGCLPKVVGRGRSLDFYRWHPGDKLKDGPFGTKEPVSSEKVVPSLFLVPLLGFSRGGDRLGFGAGYYDITLRAARQEREILAVGLAFSIQELHDLVHEPHDERLDWIVTEREAISLP